MGAAPGLRSAEAGVLLSRAQTAPRSSPDAGGKGAEAEPLPGKHGVAPTLAVKDGFREGGFRHSGGVPVSLCVALSRFTGPVFCFLYTYRGVRVFFPSIFF